MPPKQYRVGIVGFGIAGGALAILLARAGHAVTLIERAPEVGPVGAGFLLQPSGQAVLRRLGLLDGVVQHSEPIYALRAFTAGGRPLVHLRYSGVAPDCYAYGVHRGVLFEILHTAIRAEKIPIVLNQHINDWREEESRVLAVNVRGEVVGGPFDFLAAADGSRSTLRQTLNLDQPSRDYDIGAMWAIGYSLQVKQYLHQVTDGTRHLLGLLPIGGGRCNVFWSLPTDQIEAVRQRGIAAWKEDAVRLSPLAEAALGNISTFDQVAFTTYRHARPRRTHNERVVLIGDAAHSTSPHLGQGANLALLDAECLAAALQKADSPPAAFQDYRRARASQIRYYSALSWSLTPFFQSEGWVLGAGRDVALPLMSAIPLLRREMEWAMAGRRQGLFQDSRL